MRRHTWLGLVLIPVLLTACESNPVAHDDALLAELTLSPDHAHTLSPVTMTVTVRNDHGTTVTAFDTLRVERLSEGATEWRTAADLALSGSAFISEYTFASSGGHELRVRAMRTGHGEFEDVPLMGGGMTMHTNVGRAHTEAGGYRIEYENFPGHVHEGDEVAMRFWVLTPETDANGDRTPITGLDGTIRCIEPEGAQESHDPTVVSDGVYEALHTWQSAGEGQAQLSFTGPDGPAEVTFPVHVAHTH